MIKDLGKIKSFLKAKDPAKLQDLMIKNNIDTKSYHDYRIIFADGFWYAWFEIDINDYINEKTYGNKQHKG